MTSPEDLKDQITWRMQELGWSIEAVDDSRKESEWGGEVVSGVYQDYRLSVIFDGNGEPEKVEIYFEDSVVGHERTRWTRRPWYVMERLPTPTQALEMLWGR